MSTEIQPNAPLSAEQRVAAFIAANQNRILQMQLSEISDACHVSDATVVRFCRHAGYKGLKDYKIAMAHAPETASPALPVTGGEPLPELMRGLISGCMQALKMTGDQLSPEVVLRAVRAISASGNLDVYACGGSVPIASYLRHQLIKMGIRTGVYSDRTSMLLSQSRLSGKDAVLAISSTGTTKDVVDALKSARAAGAVTICITAHPESPLAAASHILLPAPGDQFLGNNTYSRLSQMAVADVLYAGLAVLRRENSER